VPPQIQINVSGIYKTTISLEAKMKKKDLFFGMLAMVLALGLVLLGCATTEVSTAKVPKINVEKLIGKYSDAKDERADPRRSKERFESLIRMLADSAIAWDDAWAGTDKMDDGTAMQVVRFTLRLNEPKPAILEVLDSDARGWQSEGIMEDKKSGAVYILVRRVLYNPPGVPADELVLVGRDSNKKVTCKFITKGADDWGGVIPDDFDNKVVKFIEELLK
jgi:hypothetical protein